MAEIKIQGQVTPASVGINVVLLEENPAKTPRGPLARVQTDEQGRYEITLTEPDPASQYRLGSRIGGKLIASDPFQIKAGQSQITVNIAGGPKAALTIKGKFVVTGRLLLPPGQDAQPLQIVLIEASEGGKKQQPVMMRKSDAKGRFRFDFTEIKEGSRYFLGAVVGRLSIGSDYFTLSKSDPKKELTIEIPAVTKDRSNLNINKNIIFFEVYEDHIQIGEALILDNASGKVIDAYDNPLVKRLPNGATDFEADRRNDREISSLNGQAIIKWMIPQGRSEVFFNYRLPLTSDDYSWGLLPNTLELETVHSGSGMVIELTGSQNQVVQKKQNHQGQVFSSQKVLIASGQETAEIEISGIGTPQKKLFYPATFLMIFLLSGLFWYLKVKLPKLQAAREA